MTSDCPWRVLIADDHALFRSGIRALLQRAPDFMVVAEAADGWDAIKRAASLQPDLVLLDLNMPGMTGDEVVRALRERQPEVKIVMLTVSEEITDLAAAIEAGAQGYLVKNIDAKLFVESLRRVMAGEMVIAPAMMEKFIALSFSRRQTQSRPTGRSALLERLTPREREILQHLAQGYSNKQIARTLDLAESTVKVHVQNLLRKLECANRVQAAVLALECGLVNEPPCTDGYRD